MAIIDLAETQVIEFCVEWGTYRTWLLVHDAQHAYNNVSTTNVTQGSGYANGYIAFTGFTKNQSPDNSDVRVNVYVSCEDLQVNMLCSNNLPVYQSLKSSSADFPLWTLIAESREVVMDTPVSCISINDVGPSTKRICEDYFGEQPLSFRALLKRYVTICLTNTTQAGTRLSYYAPIIPAQNVVNNATTTIFELFSYLRYGFVGMRGSVRRRLHLCGGITCGPLQHSRVSIDDSDLAPEVVWDNAQAQSGLCGAIMHIPHTNGGVEVEFPFYSSNLWVFAFDFNTLVDTTNDMFASGYHAGFIWQQEQINASLATLIIEDFATGEDFQFFRFQGGFGYSLS